MRADTTTLSKEFELRMLVADIFGDLAFLVADEDACALSSATQWMHGVISYRGPHSGTLECWTTPAFARGLAANMLGIDLSEEPAAGSADDALRELLNVLCGNLVTRRFGRDLVFDLGTPAASCDGGVPPAIKSDSPLICCVFVDGEPFFCRVTDTA